jgi:hypothetical protein
MMSYSCLDFHQCLQRQTESSVIWAGTLLICQSFFQDFTQVGYREPKQLPCDVALTVFKVSLVSVVR